MEISQIATSTVDWLNGYGMNILTAFVVLIVGWFIAKWLAQLVVQLLPNTKAFDETVAPMFGQLVRYGVIITALVIALSGLGVQTASIIAVIGAAGLAIALALQGTLSNIAAGVMIIWLRPFSVGDYIESSAVNGTVKQVGLFATQLRTVDGLYVFTPNAKIWDATIINYNKEMTRRISFDVGIDYSADIDLARKVLLEVATSDERVLTTPEPVVYVMNLGASSVDLQLRAWTRTADHWEARMAINEAGKKALDKAGVEIPFPHMRILAPELSPK
ncbi:mechanosensitive ion channel family protein [Maritalea porphyrae]|jgi:small conductance mechanosensitive channel|uniref:mechanosensitive ion channel family protein n=1 Tax=Maritalea porphyrae TaxID=880732 RepID=UPI0022AEC9CE|nr:mechanosensitive ion channel domain-containing protein [Maritalea porphyrae]MCZ4272646.1 mechanosensitive ion channel [Maritalea porphyrae]